MSEKKVHLVPPTLSLLYCLYTVLGGIHIKMQSKKAFLFYKDGDLCWTAKFNFMLLKVLCITIWLKQFISILCVKILHSIIMT